MKINKRNRLTLREAIENFKDDDMFKVCIDEDSYVPPFVKLNNYDLIITGSSFVEENGKSIRKVMTLYGLSLIYFEYMGDTYEK